MLLVAPVASSIALLSSKAIAAQTIPQVKNPITEVDSTVEVSSTPKAVEPFDVVEPLVLSQTPDAPAEPIQDSVPINPTTSDIAESSLEEIIEYSSENSGDSFDQVTSISQLSDVQPTDWAFQALQSLVERYGVIAGYPDGTYRGNRD